MIAHTTREILDRARYFHHQLHAFYEALKGKIPEPKLHLILDYLAEHETRLEDALDDYEEGMSEKVAETWFKFTPSEDIDDVIASVKLPDSPSLDDLMILAVKLEDVFVNLYRHAASQAVAPDIRDVFEQIEKETIKDRKRLVRDLVDMQDVI